MDITLRYGPYVWNGILRHRIERLYGLIERLEELKYKVTLKPYYIWDDLEITLLDVKVFKSRLTVFKYNCHWDRDPLCRNALRAIQKAESRMRSVMAPAQHELETAMVAVSPTKHVLHELVWSLPLPLTPAEEVLCIFLRTVMDVEYTRELLDCAIDRAVCVVEVVRAVLPSIVHEPSPAPSCTDLPATATPVLTTPPAASSASLPLPRGDYQELEDSVQLHVDATLEALPGDQFFKKVLSELMTQTLLEATARLKDVRSQLAASRLMLDHFEETMSRRSTQLAEETSKMMLDQFEMRLSRRRGTLLAEAASKLIITSITANLPLMYDVISEETLVNQHEASLPAAT